MNTELTTYGLLKMCLETKPGFSSKIGEETKKCELWINESKQIGS
jgi:hypothetical protein